jgi:hypothetical protein
MRIGRDSNIADLLHGFEQDLARSTIAPNEKAILLAEVSRTARSLDAHGRELLAVNSHFSATRTIAHGVISVVIKADFTATPPGLLARLRSKLFSI